MPFYSHSSSELEKARKALNIYVKSNYFNEESWEHFLYHLELVVEKAKADTQNEKGSLDYFNKFYKKRSKDPLLSYLKHSRNANTHTLTDTVSGVPIDGISPVLTSITIVTSDGNEHEEIVEAVPLEIKLRPVLSRDKKVINPPTKHLSKDLTKIADPEEVGNLALKYYEGFIEEIRKAFP